MEGWRGSEAEKQSQVDSEDNLSEEPEMESLFPALASLAVTTSANSEASPVSSSGVTYSVSHQDSPPLHFLQPWEGGKPLLSRTTSVSLPFPHHGGFTAETHLEEKVI